jgi:RND family efflux transporter MFP subunit
MRILIIPLILFLGACGAREHRREATAASAPVSVQVQPATVVKWPVTYEAVGTVRARTAAVISAQVMGHVQEVTVQSGDRVRPGQLLIVLDSRELDAHHRQAEAALNEARNALPEAESGVAAAKANFDLADVTFRRMNELFAKRSISHQEFDEASAKLKAAQANHEMAKARREQVSAKIAQAEAAVQAAGVTRGFARITAPFAGAVTDKRVNPGDLATPGTPLLTLEREGAHRLEGPVAESQISQIRIGQSVTVVLEALERTIGARVTEVIPVVDAAARAYTVKIDLPALPGIRSGMFGRAIFPLSARKVLAVPSKAIVERGQLQSVLVAEEGIAKTRFVTLGQTANDQREVLSGLSAGERIVSPIPPGLSDGAKVEVRP